jgi:hypothetical protein
VIWRSTRTWPAAPRGGVLELLAHELQASPGALNLIEEHPDVVLIAREAIDRVSDHYVYCALLKELPKARDARALQRIPAGRVAYRIDDQPAGVFGEFETGPLLRVQRRPVSFLCVSGNPAVDDRAHRAPPTVDTF